MSRSTVKAIRGNERAAAALGWSDNPPWRVAVEGPFGRLAKTGDDLFSALARIRRTLERDGWMLQVNAAREDTWPSPMARQAGGRKVYVLSMGRPARGEDLVDPFAPIETGRAVTVEEQEAFHDRWVGAL